MRRMATKLERAHETMRYVPVSGIRRRRTAPVFVAALLVWNSIALLPLNAAAQETEGSQAIGPRQLPLPAAASEALREAIATPVAFDISQMVPETDAEWGQLAALFGGAGGEQTRAVAAQWDIAVEESEIAGVPVYTMTPAAIDPANRDRLLVWLHGGAYVIGGGLGGAGEAVVIARYAGMKVISVEYRMPPSHPFPAAVDDVAAVWRALLEDRDAGAMALGGTSAGGGLTLAATLRLRELGLDLPGALWVATPWSDLTQTGDSRFINAGIDRLLPRYEGFAEAAAQLYAAGRDLREPLLSPVYGDFEGFPPTYLVTGTRDLLLSDTIRVHRKLRIAGVEADLNVYEGFSHADHAGLQNSPESQQAFGELVAFLARHLR